MTTKATKQERALDVFQAELIVYETLILKKHHLQDQMTAVDEELVAQRRKLLSNASARTLPVLTRTIGRKPRRSRKLPPGLVEKLQGADLRVRTSLTDLFYVLQGLGGEAHIETIAAGLRVSRQATSVRLSKGVKWNVVKRVKPGTYAIRA